MFRKASKGMAAILAINIFLVFATISLFLFLTFFTYNITIARTQTVSKSRDSSISLALINSRYLNNNNLAVALAIDEQATKTEIENSIKILSHISQSSPPRGMSVSLCYKYSLGDLSVNVLWAPCDKKYTFRTVFPFPQIFDGNKFVTEGVFESYVK